MQYYFFRVLLTFIKDPRHQLIINKAQTPLRPRHSNFCHSDNYLLFFSSPYFFHPDFGNHMTTSRNQGSFSKQETEPWERGCDVIEFIDGLLTATLMVGGR